MRWPKAMLTVTTVARKRLSDMRVGWKPRVSQKRVASIAGCHNANASKPLPNRRVPNGTHGGVGGRGLATPSYPIF